ncbi:LysM peptidoglycan-binding domain-containing protein [Pseudoalteromonas sp. OOF1S-7]|uniref:LysM peptidoglycan-binding domain-containing protein n=1 Tax=Pseudoalteromonas sp. OOF1S-7 TaxID=2917757 RepID=UPI001EF4326B|nr:LysM peptidoglycan-binding domain-containing protein [Pseudoalteromonas sp. OOF1S-7]MCG7535661.1 transglycosylase SLT domain-containing protein [Pseudoalteromonas sp. OOF1S-7]
MSWWRVLSSLRCGVIVLCSVVLSACISATPRHATPVEITAALNLQVEESPPATPVPSAVSAPLPAITEQPQQYQDLWQYIAANLSFDITPNARLQKRVAWYLSQPNYLLSVNERAAPYLYHIVKKVEQRKLPMELVLLPFVESDFRPTARSSQGAVGVWQLVDATAYHFGLKSNDWYDGRQDVLAATDAALDYLQYLRQRFKGNWLHALAAYNSGEGRVKAAIRYNQKHSLSSHFWHLKLPRETADYVPKLLALSYLLQHPQTGLQRPSLANEAQTTVLDVGQPFNFGILAALLNIDKQRLHQLNPGYLRHQSPSNGPFKALLPMDQQQLFATDFYRRQFSTHYQVKLNDTLYGIARRHNTSVAQLKQLNNKTRDLIRVGETLLIHRAHAKDDLTVDYEISPYLQQQRPAKVATYEKHHVIQDGDSLWAISRQYQVPMKDLLDWNQLTTQSLLSPGDTLLLHLPVEAPPTPPAGAAAGAAKDYLNELKTLVKPKSDP